MSAVTDAATLRLDPLASPALRESFPALATALDGNAMVPVLASALGVRDTIDSCTAGQAYFAGAWCVVRFDLVVAGRRLLVTGRMYAAPEDCSAYVAGRLEPLAASAPSAVTALVQRAVAEVSPMRLALSVFPIDGELPSLVTAADMTAMRDVLRTALRQHYGPEIDVVECEVEAGHYGRRHRCVLRYRVQTRDAAGISRRLVVYGKVADDDSLERSVAAVERVREVVGDAVAAPLPLAYLQSLRLVLFEELPGVPCIAQLVRAAITGLPVQVAGAPPLGEAIRSAARTAATLHSSGIDHGPVRSLSGDVDGVRQVLALLRPLSPALADHLDDRMQAVEERASTGGALPVVFSHGDYSYTQLLFAGDRAGLVDFDTACRAEAAVDLGHFLAYLDLAGRKSDQPAAAVVRAVGEQFMAAYVDDRRTAADASTLVERTQLYRTISLVRLAAHAWQKLKARRLRLVLDALDGSA